jgi:hypothetical protein
MSEEDLQKLGRTLTDSFCEGLDRKTILAAIEKKRQGGDAKDTIVAVWGIEDAAVQSRLTSLGLDEETVAAISLTPLVEVAWADGKLDAKERAAVLQAASDYGLTRTDISYLLLQGRLGERPGPELLETWKAYVKLLSKALDADTLATMRGEIMARARQVAEASGGILGLGSKVSKVELAVLDDLEQSFA